MPNSIKTGNKGEWAEYYALVKLLCDQKIFEAGPNMEITDQFLPVISAKTIEYGKEQVYFIDQNSNVMILDDQGNKISEFDINTLKNSVRGLFEAIKVERRRTFSIPSQEELFTLLHREHVRANSASKSDIKLVVHDARGNSDRILGYSIKSDFCAAPTLLNASGATNFVYKINGLQASAVEDINSLHAPKQVISKIYGSGGELEFVETQNRTFSNNLMRVDCIMPQILAGALIDYYLGKITTISSLTNMLESENPFSSVIGDQSGFYEVNMKKLLAASALGMMPSKAWNGEHEAQGGYIVVKEDGELVSYHTYNLDDFKTYLFENTKFDTAASRTGFGTIYKENNDLLIKLNLQIRFIS